MALRSRVILAVFVPFVALPGAADLRTYRIEADQSGNEIPAHAGVVYRGDCNPGGETPNAGDLSPDVCTCNPALPQGTPGACFAGDVIGCNAVNEGRPNGGACDPNLKGGCPPDFPVVPTTDNPPCNRSQGSFAVINDTGNGTPTLVSLTLKSHFADFVGVSDVTGIPGSTAYVEWDRTFGPAPNQKGFGSTSTKISWGTLMGWTSTATVFCRTSCPGGCNGASFCKNFIGVENKSVGVALASSSLKTDIWVFHDGGNAFDSAASFVYTDNALLDPAQWLQFSGRLVSVPALPFAALGGLGIGLSYLGRRVLRTGARPERSRGDRSVSVPRR